MQNPLIQRKNSTPVSSDLFTSRYYPQRGEVVVFAGDAILRKQGTRGVIKKEKIVAKVSEISYTTYRFEGDVPQRERCLGDLQVAKNYLLHSAPRSGFPFSNHPQSASDSSPQEDKTLCNWALTHTSVSRLVGLITYTSAKPYKKSCCVESYGSPTTTFLQGERGRLFVGNGVNLITLLLQNILIWGIHSD